MLQHVQGCHACIMRPAHAGMPATLIIRGVPEITYGHDVCTGQTIFIKNNRLTLKHPKYENRKPECAENDSLCHAQQEHSQIK